MNMADASNLEHAENETRQDAFRPARRRFLRASAAVGASGVLRPASQVVAHEETAAAVEGTFPLGDIDLRMGETLRGASLAYKTHGRLNADKSNVIVYPTPYSAQHGDIEWLIGRGKPLDPDRYFIIVPDQLGNGLSSSPSNTPAPQDRARFPVVTNQDNVAAQHRLVTERFGVSKVALVVGWSMGAQQAYQWAVSQPGMVERILASCGTAQTTPHNGVFLESLRATLTLDPGWKGGDYESPPVAGIKAFARIYAGWGFSQPFYKQELNRQLGFSTVEDFLTGFWEKRFLKRDANNLLSMLKTWTLNDVGATPGFDGSLGRALGSIRARTTVLAGQTDLYFPPEDARDEAAMIPGANFRVIPSVWGHQAGNGLNPADAQFVFDRINELLAS